MASRSTRPNGDTWIFPTCSNGKRRAVRLGKLSEDDAVEAKRRLTKLEKSFRAGEAPDPVTMAWVQSLDQKYYDRVVATGLTGVNPDAPKSDDQSLDALIRQWEATQDVEQSTKVNYSQATRNLREYFGPDRAVSSILPADGDSFLKWLRVSGRKKSTKPMARATVSRRLRTIKDVFEFAVRLTWISQSPVAHLKSQGEVNAARNYFITERLVDRLIDECADLELAAIIAVSRYATCRGPSEYGTLKWSEIDFDQRAIWWTAPKTERYGSGKRRTEQCEKAFGPLNKLWESAPSGVELVFPRLGGKASSNIYSRLEQLCRIVGVALWDKPFINMRASCETDWQAAGHSIFETAAWMGHSPDVALRHYNRVAKDQIIDLPNQPQETDRSASLSHKPKSEAQGEAR